jgi:Ca-activated chloride channel family protein
VSKVSLSVVPVVFAMSAAAAVAQQPAGPAIAGTQTAGAYAPRRPSFTSGIDLVALTVTVTDANRRYISNLDADDFQVFEDGVLQRVSFFGMSDVPRDVALLVDGSASMVQALPLARDAARGLLGTLRDGDRASLVEFRHAVRVTEPMTAELTRVAAGLERLTAAGGTALHNALYVTLKEFQTRAAAEAEVRRRVIVVLSDGEDTGSLIGFEEVLDLARRAAVTIYTVGLKNEVQLLRGKSRRNGRRFFDQSDYALRRLADETGARAFFPEGVEDLPAVYDTIAAELSSQYALGYVSRNPVRNGAWRRLRVRVAEQPGVRSRTRLGYFADARR